MRLNSCFLSSLLNNDECAATTSNKAQIVIKKPHHLKTHPRVPLLDAQRTDSATASPNETQHDISDGPEDELTRIRFYLQPPPISGVDNWGIPPEPTGTCDPEIEVCLPQLQLNKED